MKVFDKTWQELTPEERKLELGERIIFISKLQKPGTNFIQGFYCVAEMKSFPRNHDENQIGGMDIEMQGMFWNLRQAESFVDRLPEYQKQKWDLAEGYS